MESIMMINPKLPLPDESLHSYIARTIVMQGSLPATDAFAPVIANKQSIQWRSLPKLTSPLRRIFKEMLNPQQLFDFVSSSAPFYSARIFIPPRIVFEYANAVFSKPTDSRYLIPELEEPLRPSGYIFTRNTFLRVCPECLKEKLEKYGTIYFDRVWYNFTACMKHNVALVNTEKLQRFYGTKSSQKILYALFRGERINELCSLAKFSYIKSSPTITFTGEFESLTNRLPFYAPCMVKSTVRYLSEGFAKSIQARGVQIAEYDEFCINEISNALKEDYYLVLPSHSVNWLLYQCLRLILTYDSDAFFEVQESDTICVSEEIATGIRFHMIGKSDGHVEIGTQELPNHCYTCELNDKQTCRLIENDEYEMFDYYT